MSMPFVSCLCPTYNRCPAQAWLLAETVECFVRQSYPLERRELLILNDTPGQEIQCDVPGVQVINVPCRFLSLGVKYNAMVGLARGDVLMSWEDDDLSLPDRISQSVQMLGSEYDYWNPRRYWFWDQNGLQIPSNFGYAHNASAFTRHAFLAAGGYPSISGAQDREMDARLRRTVRVIEGINLPPEQYQYIYRWGCSPCHLSGRTDHDRFYAEVGQWPIQTGTFLLTPSWKCDYPSLVRTFCQSMPH